MSGDSQGSHRSGLPGSAIALLTREAGRMPLLAVTLGLRAWEQSRPVRDLAIRRGSEVLQIVAHTPLGRFLPQPVHDDDADAEAVWIAADARVAAAATAAATTVQAKPPAKPAKPPAAAAEVGAPGVATALVEKVTGQLKIEEPSSSHDLPIADFDNVSIGSLRARLRSLSVEDLVTLREWEKAHAHRLPVVTLLDNRIAKVSAT